jgi:DNA-binding transcriptional MerR regulator
MSLSIGKVAEKTGLSVHTLRYYDALGLLPQLKRAENGHRVFDEDFLGWINMLKCLRATQMPLAEMQAYAQLYLQGPEAAEAQRALLEAHRQEVAQHMAEVEAAIRLLDHKIAYLCSVTGEAAPAAEAEGTI